jgi:hypothetical protein
LITDIPIEQVVVEPVPAYTLYKQPDSLFKISVQAPSDPDLILASPRTLIQALVEHATVQEAVKAWGILAPHGSARQAPVPGGYYSGVQLAGESVEELITASEPLA